MTATKKLLIAAMLLAAGFGVARLMGRPDAPWLATHTQIVPAANRNQDKAIEPIARSVPRVATENGVRLVPDYSAESPKQANFDAPSPNTPQTSNHAMQASITSVAPPTLTTNHEHQPRQFLEPRAKLRDEAPRALEFDSRGTDTVYTRPAPPWQTAGVAPVANERSASADWRTSGLAKAEFIQDTTTVATINASYSQPADRSPGVGAVAPPPWPESPGAAGPRTHIVVDGDSLEKLAGRYLDDSSRGNEIYEANRELLANPELLPIGAELVIPMHSNRAAFEAASPQSSLTNDPSLRAAKHSGGTRPIPPPNVTPRAQLLSPQAID